LAVEPLPAADNEDAGATFAVRYRETAPMRALLLWSRSLRLFNLAQLPSWKPAMAFLFLALSGGVLGYLTVIKQKAPGAKLAGETTPRTEIVLPTPPTKAISPQPGPAATPLARPAAPAPLSGDEVIAMDIRHRAGETITRSASTPGAGLLEANKIYLEISGSRSEQARQLLLQRLPAENKFSLTDNPDETDVALIVTVAALRQGRFAFTAHIADQNGNVIWPLTPGVIGRKYEGPLEKVIATFSRDLAADLRSARRK
jgi:hypothetical protein